MLLHLKGKSEILSKSSILQIENIEYDSNTITLYPLGGLWVNTDTGETRVSRIEIICIDEVDELVNSLLTDTLVVEVARYDLSVKGAILTLAEQQYQKVQTLNAF